MKTILGIILLFTMLNTFTFADIIHIPSYTESIQSGIDMADEGDTVLVDVGTLWDLITTKIRKRYCVDLLLPMVKVVLHANGAVAFGAVV